MSKFRIVQIITNSGSDDKKSHWIIQSKNFWGWKEIQNTEGPRSKSVEHQTYEDAEKHLLKTYTGHGECFRSGNEYRYTHYTYYV